MKLRLFVASNTSISKVCPMPKRRVFSDEFKRDAVRIIRERGNAAEVARELVYTTTFPAPAQAQAAIFHWIAVWYNRKRRHSALGHISPEVYEQQEHQEVLSICV